jgi:hypothetical protein
MNLFSRYAFTFSLLSVASCNDASGPSSAIIDNTLLRLSASASANVIYPGSPVTLRATLKNEGSEPITLHFSDSCQILPYIRTGGGKSVIPSGGGWGCLTVITQLSLAPGESRVHEYVLKKTESALAGTRNAQMQFELPAGRYYFTAEVPASQVTLRSEPVELIVK